jgi:hypothetical protein
MIKGPAANIEAADTNNPSTRNRMYIS